MVWISQRFGDKRTRRIFGTRQHGIPQLKIANLYSDMDILKKRSSCHGANKERPGFYYGRTFLLKEDNKRIWEK